MRGNAMLGGRVEFHGDLPNIVASNYDPKRDSSLGQMLRVPGVRPAAKSAVVSRRERNGLINAYSHGAVPMRRPIPGLPGFGGVISSAFQRLNVRLMGWQINPLLFEAGYPRNLGLSTAVPQPETNATGGPGRSQMQQRGLFDRVQQVPRARAVVRTYPTRGQ